MNKLEQFLKPPSNINLEEEMYNASQEREEEEEINEYNQNEENIYDNGNQIQNQENENENYENNEELQNLKNKNFKNFQKEEDIFFCIRIHIFLSLCLFSPYARQFCCGWGSLMKRFIPGE